MPSQVQFRRGTTAQNDSFTGAAGEISIDTDKDTLRIHDGVIAGGFEQAKVNLTNVSGATNLSLSGITTTNSLSIGSTQVISSARQLQNIASLDATTTATIESAIAAAPNDFTSLNISGVSTFSGITTHTTSLFGTQASFSGVATASSFVGALTGNATGLSGTPNITVGNIVGTALTLSGNLTVNGTQTIINTTSLEVADKNIGIGSTSSPTDTLADGAGLTIYGTTNKTLTWSNSTPPYFNLVGGYLQVSGLDLSSLLREGVNIVAGKLSDNFNINLEYGMVFLFTTTETTTSTPNIRYSSSISLNSVMNIGEAISVTLITTAAAAAYSAQLTIDGNAVTEYWIGGSAPSSGGSSGYDLHTYTIIKTASATFAVIANRSKTSA